ncbi:hypothetical protein EVAR_34496_1 [Eumeta japonica]|uniref:Uncharacterized protein n=1 Tax=Eumeta variegata TaxID=151549 RepID=A0A4C1WUM3_EUMVA|nr:hypothetical protein EVAR_34496_1 [Eumeta japonica]
MTDWVLQKVVRTAVYYKKKLYCCPVDVPLLCNVEASACRLAVTGHSTLIIVSIYLSPSKRSPASLFRLGSYTGEEQPSDSKVIIDWKRVSTALEKVVTPNLNVILDDIVSKKDIDTATGALTKHIRTVVKNCQRKDRDKTESIADSIELQCSLNPIPHDPEHVSRVENEVCHRISLPLKDHLPSVSLKEAQNGIKNLKTRKASGLDGPRPFYHHSSKLYYLAYPFATRIVFLSKIPIRAEVPHDSTLSPLLYSSYTNGILHPQSGVQLAAFADDTALYQRGSNFRQITLRLQMAIDELTQWIKSYSGPVVADVCPGEYYYKNKTKDLFTLSGLNLGTANCEHAFSSRTDIWQRSTSYPRAMRGNCDRGRACKIFNDRTATRAGAERRASRLRIFVLPLPDNTIRFICIIRWRRPPAEPTTATMNQKRNSNFKAGRPRPARRLGPSLPLIYRGRIHVRKSEGGGPAGGAPRRATFTLIVLPEFGDSPGARDSSDRIEDDSLPRAPPASLTISWISCKSTSDVLSSTSETYRRQIEENIFGLRSGAGRGNEGLRRSAGRLHLNKISSSRAARAASPSRVPGAPPVELTSLRCAAFREKRNEPSSTRLTKVMKLRHLRQPASEGIPRTAPASTRHDGAHGGKYKANSPCWAGSMLFEMKERSPHVESFKERGHRGIRAEFCDFVERLLTVTPAVVWYWREVIVAGLGAYSAAFLFRLKDSGPLGMWMDDVNAGPIRARGRYSDSYEILHFFAKPMDRVGRILKSCRLFEILDIGCGLEAKVGIGVLQHMGNNSTLNEVQSVPHKVAGDNPA